MRDSVHLVCTETEIVGIAGIGDAPVSAPFVDATFQLTNRKIGEHGTRARALRECSRTGAEQSERRGYAVGISSAGPPPDSTARARPSGAFRSPWGSGPSCIPHRPVPEWRSAEASSSGATSLPVRRTDAPTGGYTPCRRSAAAPHFSAGALPAEKALQHVRFLQDFQIQRGEFERSVDPAYGVSFPSR